MTDQNQFIERMAKAAMILPVSQGRVPTVVNCKAGSDAARDALHAAIDSETSHSLGTTLPALGAMTAEAKQMLNRPLGAIRTYLYEETMTYDRGRRLVMVTRMPAVLQFIAEKRGEVLKNLADFIPRYRKYYDFKNGMLVDLNGAGQSIQLIKPEKLMDAVYVDVGVPQRIPACDLSGINLPAGLAAQIQERTNAEHIAKAEAIRGEAIGDLLKAVETVITQVDVGAEGKRLSESLLTNAKRTSRNLREVVESYDNDPRLLQLADLVDQQIGQYNVKSLKQSDSAKNAVTRAAKTVRDGLKTLADAPAPAPVPVTTVAVGDSLLADLID
jgi:hypothetical protein